MKNEISMTQFTATVADCLGINAPDGAEAKIPFMASYLQKRDISKVDKVLIYNPDAIGMWLFQKYTTWFAPVLNHTQLGIPVHTVMPSVTPVCFGTMYTGVMPSVHGIQKYEKYQLSQESLFDCLAKNKKRTAIVAVENSSMAILFGGRDIDYFILPYDNEVNEKTKELIAANEYDVIVVYNQEYDDVMHRTFPESEESLQALKNHIAAFDALCKVCEENWKEDNAMVCWATDHGIHTNADGHGSHGADIEEDMNVMHFLGVWKGNN
ncbi:type I phosphodiesterase/nucleotide pyrophosphatase [Firmicutes bacterium CAG:194]|nr:type I phosphodiesterase/nucleotide pyrophosphatase [Firmicutes bacterium CAG:194]